MLGRALFGHVGTGRGLDDFGLGDDVTKNSTVSSLAAELRPFVPGYVVLFLFSFFTPILYMANPVYMAQIMDRVMLSRNETTLWALFGITMVIMVISTLLDFTRDRALRRIGIALDARLTKSIFDALHRRAGGSAGATLADINNVRDFLSGHMVSSLFDAIWSPLFIVVMFLIHTVYGITALTLIALSAALSVVNHIAVAGLSKAASSSQIRANEFGTAAFRNAEVVRTLGMLPAARDTWYGLHRTTLGWQSAAANRNATISWLIRFLRTSQNIIVYTVGTLLFLQNEIGPSTIIYAFIVMLRGIGPIDYLVSNWRQYSAFKASAERLDKLLSETHSASKPIELPRPSGSLVVDRLVAAPPGSDRIVINDLSFSVVPGRVLGIVGQSGAGKTCLARLLVGAWRPRRGTVSLDGHQLTHWDQDKLGTAVGYLPQDIEMLPGTVAANIARFNPTVTKDSQSLIAAANMTGIQELIRDLPHGFATVVGTGGHTLSGGQRQRLALARALFGNPHLVILDEPSSNLDAPGEQSLARAVQSLRENNAITILISHKLSLLSLCDDVLVLHGGVAQAFGPRALIVEKMARTRAVPNLTVVGGGSGEGRA